MQRGNVFGGVCLCVCLFCLCVIYDNFRKPRHRKFILGLWVHLEGIRVKFVYEDHRVKVKVSGAKKREIPSSRNVKLRWAINPVL